MSHSVFLNVRRERFILFTTSRFAHVNQRQHPSDFTSKTKCCHFIHHCYCCGIEQAHGPHIVPRRQPPLVFWFQVKCEADDGQLALLDTRLLEAPRKSAFFSSDESEEEEDHRKKFKIKIKPLPADQVVAAPSVDELKASIGNIALSPSPLVSHAAITAPLDSSGPVRAPRCAVHLVSIFLFLE